MLGNKQATKQFSLENNQTILHFRITKKCILKKMCNSTDTMVKLLGY